MRWLFFHFKFFFKTFFRIIYSFINKDENCVVCGKKTFLLPLCESCKKVHYNIENSIHLKRCLYCGKILLTCEEKCFGCREDLVLKSTNRVIPLFAYRLWNKELMYKWKTLGIRCISDMFASFVFEALKNLDLGVLVPVPPREGKIQKNGWDQIDELCQILKFRFGVCIFPILKRDSTVQQKKLDRSERLKSIGKAYSLVDEKSYRKILNTLHNTLPSKVCLIDDVCTTGATLECCAQLLKSLGIKEVNAITLFAVN